MYTPTFSLVKDEGTIPAFSKASQDNCSNSLCWGSISFASLEEMLKNRASKCLILNWKKWKKSDLETKKQFCEKESILLKVNYKIASIM